MRELTAGELQSYTMQIMGLAVAKKQHEEKANRTIEDFTAAAAVVGKAMGMDPAHDAFMANQRTLVATLREQRDAKTKWFEAEESRLQAEFLASLQD